MSIRYVWERYNKKTTYEAKKTRQSTILTVYTGSTGVGNDLLFTMSIDSPPTIDPDTGKLIFENKRVDIIGSSSMSDDRPASVYCPCLPCESETHEMPEPTSWLESPDGKGYWVHDSQDEGTIHRLFLSNIPYPQSGTKPDKSLREYDYCVPSRTGVGQGARNGSVAGSTSSQYPSNGVSGEYWYVYSGTDSIDPVSISTPVNKWLYIGQQLTITASPSTSIKYGGTISYQYQVQLNDGSWTNIGSKTTATSINYTVPDGTTSIAFRVQASDNMGFTSADWIQSETYAVSKFVRVIGMKIHRMNASGEYEVEHMETDTTVVLMNSGTTLEDELVKIISEIERRGG